VTLGGGIPFPFFLRPFDPVGLYLRFFSSEEVHLVLIFLLINFRNGSYSSFLDLVFLQFLVADHIFCIY
jgi:hypothetical protein